jgi:hypothetical protein
MNERIKNLLAGLVQSLKDRFFVKQPVDILLGEYWAQIEELWKSELINLPRCAPGKLYYASDIVKFIEQDVAPKYGFKLILKPNETHNGWWKDIPCYWIRFNDPKKVTRFTTEFGVEE